MAEKDHDPVDGAFSTALIPYLAVVEHVTPLPHALPHAPFVAQLIANAREVPNPYRRRKSDRTGPLNAYASTAAPLKGDTRRIV